MDAAQINVDKTTITGVILAGGQGRRMGGEDKGLMLIDDQPLVAHLVSAFKPQVKAVVINANRNQERYAEFADTVIADQLSDYQGPLAGFASAMQQVDSAYIVTIPCDAPNLQADTVQRLISALEDQQAELSVAFDGTRLQPVYALIPVSLLPSLLAFLDAGDRKIDRWYSQHNMAKADFSDISDMFVNLNTPEQREAFSQHG